MQNRLSYNNIHNIIPHTNTVIDRTAYEGWNLPSRTIMDQELVFIVGGDGSFNIEGNEYKVKPGMLFYFYPNLIHSANTSLDNPMHFIAVHFSLATAQYGGGSWFFNESPPLLDLQPVTHPFAFHKTMDILRQLYDTWMHKESGYQWQSSILLQQCLFNILHQQAFVSQNHGNIVRVEKTMAYIRKNYSKGISIGDLSTLVNLSPGYFSKIFKEVTGKTPVEYIHTIRIDSSKELLLNTSLKIKEVARISGFKDEFYFTRVFKKIEGCPPTYYNIQNTTE